MTLFAAKSTFPAFNGWKLTILLEEMKQAGVLSSFVVRDLDLDAMEHKQDWFLKINPNGRIPALIDHKNGDLAVFESGAMMQYLAERYGRLMPTETAARYAVIQWLCFQLSGVGPMQGQAHAFTRYIPEKIDYAISRFQNETRRLYEVLEERLKAAKEEAERSGEVASKGFVAGAYSIADIALFPWVAYHEWAGVSLDGLPCVQAWLARLYERPAVQKGLEYNKKDIKIMLAEADAIQAKVAATTLDKVSTPTPGSGASKL